MLQMGINHLDLRTIVITTALIYSLLALIIALVWFIHRQEKSLFFWSAASAVGAMGMAFIGLRGTVSPYLSFTIGNVLCVACLIIMWMGNCAYISRKISKKTVFCGIGAIFLIWIVIHAIHKDDTLRVAVTSGFAALGCFLCGGSLMYRIPKYLRPIQLPAGAIMIVWGMFWAYRSAMSFQVVNDTFSPNSYQIVSFIIAFIAPLCWTITQIIMVSYRHVFARQQDLAHYSYGERAYFS